MDEQLNSGFQIKTVFDKTAAVETFLAEGGQGRVYTVDYGGERKVLKWYKKTGLGENPKAFYENIKQNVLRGKPSEEFLWPLDITEWTDGTFGYIMDLRPEGYYEITEYMLCKCRFRSYRAVINAALGIVNAFRILHNAGYSYQDLNDGNFFIHPENGKVLICDNDNVAPDGTETGIIGKPRYMAPEIVLGKKKPDSLTDRFSMSVLLYILFCLNHPLEGKRYMVPALTPALQEKLYGSEPWFIMDPENTVNPPHPLVHKNSLTVWPSLPDYMQKIFLKAFSQKALLEKPEARPREVDWLNALTRFRSEVVSCASCGNENFLSEEKPCVCEECGKPLPVAFKLKFSGSGYSIPAVKGSRIYRCQLGVCHEKEALSPVAAVLKKTGSEALGLQNKSGKSWKAVTTKGVDRKVAPEEVVPLKAGITLTIENETISILANK